MEFTYTSPASPISGQDVTWTAAPGLIYLRRWGEIAVEATVPLNRATGSNIGVVALLHVFVDDLLPRGIGAPLFQ